jgi:hypothetical protein
MNDLPIQMLCSEPDTDELITRDFIKGAVFALIVIAAVVGFGLAIYFK